MPDPEQATLDDRPAQLDEFNPSEPVDEHGSVQVITARRSNTRTSFHRQHSLKDGVPACIDHMADRGTEWTKKPKQAMVRSSTEPCRWCYPELYEGADSE